MKRAAVVIVVTLALLWAGYLFIQRRRGQLDQQEFRAALQKYLAAKPGLNMSGMNMEIISMQQQGNQADAVVEFRAKQGGPSMQFTYHLERRGGAWVVQGTGGQAAGHPGTGEAAPSTPGQLPPGHPPVGRPGSSPPQTTPPSQPAHP